VTTSIVFTFLGTDKPGLIEALSNTVADNNGNWQESRMSHLAGQFAGITQVTVQDDSAAALKSALIALSNDELTITVQQATAAEKPVAHNTVALTLIGNDRPGIVREVSSALAGRDLNIYTMETNLSSAPMSGDLLFEATAVIERNDDLVLSDLIEQLDDISEELDIDIKVE